MPAAVVLGTPLADALQNVVQSKLAEVGWSTGGLDDSALAEYIMLMMVNGKTQEEIALELSNDLLGLAPEDNGAVEFTKWLFQQVDLLSGAAAQGESTQDAQNTGMQMDTAGASEAQQPAGQDAAIDTDMDVQQEGSM